MKTEILPITSPSALALAQAEIQSGNVIAAPTDTVYGVMCEYNNTPAIAKLYEVKGRPPERAIPVLIGAVEQLAELINGSIPPWANELMDAYWPGALTLVLPASARLPARLTAGQPTVAVRIPAHPDLVHLILRVGPLAATSANLSGQPDALSATQVQEQLGGRLSLILDGGPSAGGVSSTIVAMSSETNGKPTILRPGPLAAEIQARFQLFG